MRELERIKQDIDNQFNIDPLSSKYAADSLFYERFSVTYVGENKYNLSYSEIYLGLTLEEVLTKLEEITEAISWLF